MGLIHFDFHEITSKKGIFRPCLKAFKACISIPYCFAANSVDLENSPLSSNPEKELKAEVTSDSKTRLASSTKKNCKDKPTRVRTVLNEKQLSTLKRCYAANPRPDSVMKEQLVDLTGLSPRVIRVWFQNKRCKDKKKMMLNGGDGKIGVG